MLYALYLLDFLQQGYYHECNYFVPTIWFCFSGVCREDEFTCGDGRCIELGRVCDGVSDCRNDLDETNCPDGKLIHT